MGTGILGIGIDLIEIDRIERALERAAEDHALALPHAAALGMAPFHGYHARRVTRLAELRHAVALLRLRAALSATLATSRVLG
jgi:phosphopantetheinyl transferase (holo-ACP synthase)